MVSPAIVLVFIASLATVRADHTGSYRRSWTSPSPARFVPPPTPITTTDFSTPLDAPGGAQQSKSFNEFCVELIADMALEAQGSGGDRGVGGSEGGDTIVGRTVGEDGTTISLENNPEGVQNNTVEISPVVFNVADVNLVAMENGVALFLPLDQVPIQDMLKNADLKNGGLELVLQPENMPSGLSECMAP